MTEYQESVIMHGHKSGASGERAGEVILLISRLDEETPDHSLLISFKHKSEE